MKRFPLQGADHSLKYYSYMHFFKYLNMKEDKQTNKKPKINHKCAVVKEKNWHFATVVIFCV